MVAVLPYVPSFGEKLTDVLAQSAGHIGEGLQKRSAQNLWKQLTTPQQLTGQSQNAVPGMPGQTGQLPSPQQSPISPLQQILTKEGGPNLNDIAMFTQAAQGVGIDPKVVSDYFLGERKLASKEASDIRKMNLARQSDTIKKQQEANVGRRESIRKERQDLNLGLNAVQEGNVGGFDINYLANLLGPAGEPLKSVKGVQLESAMKNVLFDTINKISGRPNQWIEQQVQKATAGIGKKEEANEVLIKTALAKLDIDEKVLDAKEALINQYEQAGITPPSNIDKLSEDIAKPYAEHRQDKLAYDTRVLYEKSLGPKSLKSLEKVPQGTMFTLERRDQWLKMMDNDREKVLKTAHKLGYTIPTANLIMTEQQPEAQLEPTSS
jgi:hypothetical protein